MSHRGTIRAGLWAVLDNAFAAALAFGFFVVTARLLTPEVFGAGAIALGLLQLLAPLVESLFYDAIVQRRELTRCHVQTCQLFCAALAIVLAAALTLCSGLLGRLLNAPELAAILPWMSIGLVFAGLSAVPAAEARRELDFRFLALRTIIGRTLATALGVYLAMRGFGIWSIVVQYVGSIAIPAVLLLARAGVRPPASFDGRELREFLLFGVSSVGTQFLIFGASRGVVLVIGVILGPIAAGVWSVGFKVVEPLQVLLATATGQLSLSLFARRQHDVASMRDAFMAGTRLLSILVFPLFAGIAFSASELISLLLGERWLAAVPITQIVCAVTLLVSSRQLGEICITAIGKPALNLLVQAVSAAVSVVGAGIGALVSLDAAALGWSTRLAPILLIYALLLRTELGISAADQIRPSWRPLLATVVMGMILVTLRTSGVLADGQLLRLTTMILLGAASYISVLLLLDSMLIREAASLLSPGRSE